jgi:hypothetical protein
MFGAPGESIPDRLLDGTSGERAIKLHQLNEWHNLRLAQHSQTGIAAEEDDESKEP